MVARSVPDVLQGMNKIASGVQLRFNVDTSIPPPDPVKLQVRHIVRNGITTEEGVLIIEAKRFRTQEQNREDAIARLIALLFKAAKKPKLRRKTKPTAASQAERGKNTAAPLN